MSPKKQFTLLKEAQKLAKLRKIEAKSEILIEDISFLFENKSLKRSWISQNNILYQKDYD